MYVPLDILVRTAARKSVLRTAMDMVPAICSLESACVRSRLEARHVVIPLARIAVLAMANVLLGSASATRDMRVKIVETSLVRRL